MSQQSSLTTFVSENGDSTSPALSEMNYTFPYKPLNWVASMARRQGQQFTKQILAGKYLVDELVEIGDQNP